MCKRNKRSTSILMEDFYIFISLLVLTSFLSLAIPPSRNIGCVSVHAFALCYDEKCFAWIKIWCAASWMRTVFFLLSNVQPLGRRQFGKISAIGHRPKRDAPGVRIKSRNTMSIKSALNYGFVCMCECGMHPPVLSGNAAAMTIFGCVAWYRNELRFACVEALWREVYC